MKWIDLPPVWLLGAIALAWAVRWPEAWQGAFLPGAVSFALAAGLTAGAVTEFLRARTTIIPRGAPSALITGGVFRITRNPIYLADLLILAGAAFWFGSVLGLLLVPALGLVLRQRFILGEEARLAEVYGPDFEDYASRVRRWI